MKRFLPLTLYTALALAVMLPLYAPGYLFLLDMVMAPQIDLAHWREGGALSPQLPLAALLKLMSFALPTDLIQKLLLTAALIIPGLAMERLARRYLSHPWTLVSGIFYMLNPWVYERFLAGHWLVLIGYGIFPLSLALLIRVLEAPSWKHSLAFAALCALYPLLNIHWAYIAYGFSALLAAAWYFFHASFSSITIKKLFLGGIASFLLIFAVNAFWFKGFFAPHATFPAIASEDLAAFATRPDPVWGVWINALSLYGFWNDEYLLPKDTLALWPLITFAVLALSLLGGLRLMRKKDPLGIALAITLIPVIAFGVGYGDTLTRPFAEMLTSLIPGLKGLRETAKALGVLAAFYALCAPVGLHYLIKICVPRVGVHSRPLALGLPALLCAILLINVHSMFWGFSGQLTPSSYPASWERVNEMLIRSPDVRTALFLPWHGYLAFPFTRGHRISNPAIRFFATPTIAAETVDNAYLFARDTQKPWDQTLFRLVQGISTLEDEQDMLRAHEVTHVIIAEAYGRDRYAPTESSPLLTPVLIEHDIALYRIAY